jgi:hypothetical protein
MHAALQVIGRLANGMALSPGELQRCGQLFQHWQQALFVVPADLPGGRAQGAAGRTAPLPSRRPRRP